MYRALPILISVFTLAVASNPSPVWAAKKKHKKRASAQVHAPEYPLVPETYSATEDEMSGIADPMIARPSVNPPIISHVSVETAPAPTASSRHVAKQAPKKRAASADATQANPKYESYDPVPSDQTEPLARRLQLCEELIRRHGRAYDYRLLTVRQLEKILADLDAEAAPTETAESSL